MRVQIDAVDGWHDARALNIFHRTLFISIWLKIHVSRFVHDSWHTKNDENIYTSLDMYPICNQILIPTNHFIYLIFSFSWFLRCVRRTSVWPFLNEKMLFLSTAKCNEISTANLCLRCKYPNLILKFIFQGIPTIWNDLLTHLVLV